MMFLKGIGALLLTLAGFSVFSLKFPKGSKAMGGLADAAVATFLVEAIFKYICGDFIGIAFLGEVGAAAGSMGGVASAALVGLAMGTNPVYAIASAAAVAGFGILPGFIAAYVLYFLLKRVHKLMPAGLDVIVCSLLAAGLGRGIAVFVDPAVNSIISVIGDSITIATTQSPLLMGFVLGGLMKMICTSPLSSMALTAMLGLTGLPMGIAAAMLGIINNAPGTASPIPGLLAPFAFNSPVKVLLAMGIAAAAGTICGLIGSTIFAKLGFKKDVRTC